MDDLISREAAIEAAIDGADDWDGGYNPSREEYIRSRMDRVPAVDTVPVVRCRDCEHAHRGGCMLTLEGGWNGDDWYCADGERRENDAEC